MGRTSKNLEKFLPNYYQRKPEIETLKLRYWNTKSEVLAHELSSTGIKQDMERVKAISKIPSRTNVSEVRGLIGLLSYYHRFVPSFAAISEPLILTTEKNASFKWDNTNQTAFKRPIESLTSYPIIANFNNTDEIRVKTDASISRLGGILEQKQNNDWRNICCTGSEVWMSVCGQPYRISLEPCLRSEIEVELISCFFCLD